MWIINTLNIQERCETVIDPLSQKNAAGCSDLREVLWRLQIKLKLILALVKRPKNLLRKTHSAYLLWLSPLQSHYKDGQIRFGTINDRRE